MRVRGVASVAALAALAAPASSPAAWRHTGEFGREGAPTGSDFELGRGVFSDGRLPSSYQGLGIGDRQYNSPGGLAFAPNGDIFVADTANNRIQRYSPTGRFKSSFGRFGFDPGSTDVKARGGFILVEGVAAAGSSLFIADNRNDRAVKASQRGRFLARLGRRGSLAGEMVSPWGIAAGRGVVYVVDQGNSRIQRFSVSGRHLGSFGRFGSRPRDLRAPYGIAVAGGKVFVSDTQTDAVKVFTASGRFVRQFGGRGTANGKFDQPAGLAADRRGRVLVADCRNQRVQVFSGSGQFRESFGEGFLRDPTFVAVSPAGKVAVSDYRRVVRFSPAARRDPLPAPGTPPADDGTGLGGFPEGTGRAAQSGVPADGWYGEPPGRLACISQAEGTGADAARTGR